MQIERINNNQLKFIFRGNDLVERNIRLADQANIPDVTQKLFTELMQYIHNEKFASDNTNLMFEAMRVGVDSLIVVVTKIEENIFGVTDERKIDLGIPPGGKCRYKRRRGLIKGRPSSSNNSISIFSFNNLEEAAASVVRLPETFEGKSMVYKMEGMFYLVLINESKTLQTSSSMEKYLHEFGIKHFSGDMSIGFLNERGEALIKEDAITKLMKYHLS